MDPLGQMETGNSTSELGDLRQHFCSEIKATGDEGTLSFCLLRKLELLTVMWVLYQALVQTPQPFSWSDWAAPLISIGKRMGQVGGVDRIARELLLPQMVSEGAYINGSRPWALWAVPGNIFGWHNWEARSASGVLSPSTHYSLHGTGQPPTGESRGFPIPHVIVSRLAEQTWVEWWRCCW